MCLPTLWLLPRTRLQCGLTLRVFRQLFDRITEEERDGVRYTVKCWCVGRGDPGLVAHTWVPAKRARLAPFPAPAGEASAPAASRISLDSSLHTAPPTATPRSTMKRSQTC